MIAIAFKKHHTVTKIGYVIFLFMAVTTVIGYSLFPLTGDKTEMNFQNMMHIIVTVIVVFTTIFSFFFIAIGYMKKERLKLLGTICFVAAVMITVFGATNPISMAMGLDILGLTERLVIFTLQAFVFFLSFIYTFNSRMLSANK